MNLFHFLESVNSLHIPYSLRRRSLSRSSRRKPLDIWDKTKSYHTLPYEDTAWKMSKYGVISDPHFPVFGLNTGKYGPEITPYLDTFHAVREREIKELSW